MHRPPVVWAYNADEKHWQQQTRPAGLWLTSLDGTVIVRTDGRTLRVETRPSN